MRGTSSAGTRSSITMSAASPIAVLTGLARADRHVIVSNISSRPAHPAFNFASGNSEIAEHVIVHAGEFFEGATGRELGFDSDLCSFQERKQPGDGAARDRSPSRPAARQSCDAMDLVEHSS